MIKATYVHHMGSDKTVVNSARVSYDKHVLDFEPYEVDERDRKLISYLAKHKHMTPFEHCFLTMLIECPLFVRSQIHRHRTFSYNEVSRRYTGESLEFFRPTWKEQATKNKQGSADYCDVITSHAANAHQVASEQYALEAYNEMIRLGVSREQARMVLPQSLMTKFYMSGSLRNWQHFLTLRLDEHAQGECREVAELVESVVKKLWPVAYQALKENT